jgi:hypothetical protein
VRVILQVVYMQQHQLSCLDTSRGGVLHSRLAYVPSQSAYCRYTGAAVPGSYGATTCFSSMSQRDNKQLHTLDSTVCASGCVCVVVPPFLRRPAPRLSLVGVIAWMHTSFLNSCMQQCTALLC